MIFIAPRVAYRSGIPIFTVRWEFESNRKQDAQPQRRLIPPGRDYGG
ncbi:hypothetical protein [Rossellomorea marisflavi]